MITTSHLVYNWALAKVTEKTEAAGGMQNNRRLGAFVLGAVLPDLPTYIFFTYFTFIVGASQSELWDTLYFDSAWTPFITLSHSFILWPIALAIGHTLGYRFLTWLSASALFHVTLDFFVHAEDAYRHFWPLTDFTFNSPISYWNPTYYGNISSSLDAIIVAILLLWLYRTSVSRTAKYSSLALLILYGLLTFTPLLYTIFN